MSDRYSSRHLNVALGVGFLLGMIVAVVLARVLSLGAYVDTGLCSVGEAGVVTGPTTQCVPVLDALLRDSSAS